MSGGYFSSSYSNLEYLADELQEELESNSCEINDQTVRDSIEKTITRLRITHIYMKRLDWLFSGDDGLPEFKTRLQDDIKKFMSDTQEELRCNTNMEK